MEFGGVIFEYTNQLLLFQVFSERMKVKHAQGHNLPHSSRPWECGWLVAFISLRVNTSKPPLSRIKWVSNLHGNSP